MKTTCCFRSMAYLEIFNGGGGDMSMFFSNLLIFYPKYIISVWEILRLEWTWPPPPPFEIRYSIIPYYFYSQGHIFHRVMPRVLELPKFADVDAGCHTGACNFPLPYINDCKMFAATRTPALKLMLFQDRRKRPCRLKKKNNFDLWTDLSTGWAGGRHRAKCCTDIW